MKLVTFRDKSNRITVGIMIKDYIIDIVKLNTIPKYKNYFPQFKDKITLSMLDVLEYGKDFLEKLDEIINEGLDFLIREIGVKLSEVKLMPPIPNPPIIYALARNYRAHAEEVGLIVPKEPAVFIKAPTAIIGPEDYIIYPKFCKRVDYEAELAVVIAKNCKNASKENAMEYVFGYTCINDITARDIQMRCIKENSPWDLTKSIDTFAPIGPCIVTKDQIPDPHNLKIELRVNDIVKQSSNTKYMIFKIPEIIEYISKFVTLKAGTIIATGTPEGIGELKPGDIVEVEIEKIGTLRNEVIG